MTDPPPATPQPPSPPGWVKTLGIVAALAIVAIVVVAILADGHGPGRHLPGDQDERQTPPVENTP